MDGSVFVLLHSSLTHLASTVLEAGCTPVIDATGREPVTVPDGAWVRIRPGRPAPGHGPVVLAEDGAPVLDRPTWLETSVPRDVPAGFAGLVLLGSEAGGPGGEADGLELLARTPDPTRVILHAGLGPTTTAAAAALGARGVLVAGAILGCPEIGLRPGLIRHLQRPDAEMTTRVGGLRVGNPPTAPVLRRLLAGEDPFVLSEGLYQDGDLRERLWILDQGAALAVGLAERFGSLSALLRAWNGAWTSWAERTANARRVASGRTAGTAAGLELPGSVAGSGGPVGSGTLWELAGWLDRPLSGSPWLTLPIGGQVVGSEADIEAVRSRLLARARELGIGQRPEEKGATPVPAPAPAAPPAAAAPAERPPPEAAPGPSSNNTPVIAIIGMGVRMPKANHLDQFWQNILRGVYAITEVPSDRWDAALYFDPDHDRPDKTYSKIGGFLQDFVFDAKKFRIPPRVARQVDPVQQIALHAVDDALRHAGLQTDARDTVGRPFNRERCAVILGNSLGGELKDQYAVRVAWPDVLRRLQSAGLAHSLDAAAIERLEAAYKAGLPDIDEDSMPGELSNVIAGRVANAFDLRGPNFTTDAACASSMAAIQAAVKGLQDGDFDLAITGGVDRSMNVPTYVKFCKIGALSAEHSAPFDETANGFVMGEGGGVLILKRLDDAQRDGDTIYALIRTVGASSDGKGKGITAPNPIGQRLALERAYTEAGIDPASVDLIEAHGTSTVVGDAVELTTLTEFIGPGRRDSRGPIRVGSVKSMIGHLKSAAGAASVIKAALALHYRVYPPSLNFKKARADVPFSVVPLRVQTAAEPWPDPAPAPRRAGVSSFGFGGTNFHIVLEEWVGQSGFSLPRPAPARSTPEVPAPSASTPVTPASPAANPPAPSAPAPAMATSPAFPLGIWAVSGRDKADLLENLRILEAGGTPRWRPSDPCRIAAASESVEDLKAKVDRAIKVVEKDQNADLLRARGIWYEDAPLAGKVAFLFTGQGSQYVDMGLELASRFPVVSATYQEADRITTPHLGRPITDIIKLLPGEVADEKELILRRTEYSQPATLTMDVAILRLLAGFGVYPDMVAGHSLGEYGACVAAGIMDFEQALLAVSARGREMAAIRLEDPGKMAGIATDIDVVEEVLAEVNGYVIAANKNCPSQTVIAGASDAVDEAVERFRARGVTVYRLPVSHAFHSAIVAPASEPLKIVLGRLGLRAPVRPITTNVTSEYYPVGADAVPQIIDLLARQISAPVEWTAQVERMYGDGARVFVEIGPKRALTGFVTSILKRRDHRAFATNNPKRGEIWSFLDALAGLVALGCPVQADPGTNIPEVTAPARPRLATPEAVAAAREAAAPADPPRPPPKKAPAQPTVSDDVIRDFLNQAGRAGLDGLDGEAFARAVLPGVQALLATAFAAARAAAPPAPALAPPPPAPAIPAPPPQTPTPAAPPRAYVVPSPGAFPTVVCSGASVGLPGGAGVFHPENLARILHGENRISHIGGRTSAFMDLGLVRLVKDPSSGQGSFLPIHDETQVIRLAGVKGPFDLREWGVPDNLIAAFDITTQLAIAAALEALRDAGIPLQRTYKIAANGKRVPQGWELPEALRDDTGVVFGSAFPGIDAFARHALRDGRDENGHFDRRFLFQVLCMGHSQLAQLLGARGPNLHVNAACASPTQAVGIAQDLIRTRRCRRVIVVSSDDVTNDAMLRWIGGGFMAAGAASTHDVVEETALPFDARRHGLILGMGAHGMVLETEDACLERGTTPIARLLDATFVNSAFHGTRLHPTHIAEVVEGAVGRACREAGVSTQDMASDSLFMSHETYTPARGGSAQAEIAALRRTFGPAAEKVVLTNTKGYTGHPMGAGVEETVALKALQYGILPPVANYKVPDPELGTLTIARGEKRRVRFAIRLAAGFGSQLALSVWEGVARDDERVFDAPRRLAWLQAVTGFEHPHEAIEQRTLRVSPGETAHQVPLRPEVSPADVRDGRHPLDLQTPDFAARLAPPPTPLPTPPPAARSGSVQAELIALIAAKTGYAPAEIDPSFALEADLGIDTVKQAEIFGEIRERHGLARDDDFRLADYDTIEKLAAWLESKIGASPSNVGTIEPTTPDVPPEPETKAAPAPVASAAPLPAAAPMAAQSADSMTQELCGLIAEKTGYASSELDPDFELEADLGIDTVKQVEIFGEIRERHGLARDDTFRLADYPTIRALAGWLANATSAGTSSPGPAPETSGEPSSPGPAPAPVPAERPAPPTPIPDPEPSPSSTPDEVLSDLLSLVAEKTGYDKAELDPTFELEADLGIDTVKQAEIFGELRERYGLERDDSFKLADYPTLIALASWLHEQRTGSVTVHRPPGAPRAWSTTPLPAGFFLRRPVLVPAAARRRGGVDGKVVFVAGTGPLADAIRAELARRGARWGEPAQIVVDAAGDVRASFRLAKALGEHRPTDWISVTSVGWASTVSGADRAADFDRALQDGSVAGFTKALGREWADTHARVVDTYPGDSDVERAAAVVDEIEARGHSTEIFRHGRTRRTVTYRIETSPPAGALPAGAVVLVTGGGRGVTARCAEEIARRSLVTLIIAGRGAPGAVPLDVEAEKANIRALLVSGGERVTPAEVERRLAPKKRAEEVRQTLDALRKTGATVRYVQLDTADERAVAETVRSVVSEFGRLDLVIHGAGVEESRLIADKDEGAFSRVYDGKALGGRVLADSVPAETFLVTMGSVAGRFGNPGQVDYAAANDGLARLALTRPRSLHLDWTAWDDVGMAVRGGMKRLLTDRGVELLPADAGASVLVDLVAAGVEGELVVAGALGDFLPPPDHPLLDRAEVGEAAVATRRLSLASDPWLADHAIADVPVLPGVIGLELMAAAAALVSPGAAYAGAREVRFAQPAKLHRGEPLDVTVEATVEGTTVRASLTSTRTLRTGRPQQTPHFTAEILLGSESILPGLPDAMLPDEHLDQAAIYARFFHGPKFQVLSEVQGVAADALLAEGAVDTSAIAEGLLTEPLLLEAAFQAAGLHHMLIAGEMALPSSIDQVQLLGGAASGERLTLLVRKRGEVYDVDVDGPAGPLLRLRGFRMAVLGPLEPEKKLPDPPWDRPAVFDDSTPTVTPTGVIATATADEDPDAWLAPEEIEYLRSRGTDRRIRDRLAGRIAAKRALAQLTGVDPRQIRIPSATSGEPIAEVPGHPHVRVSITHRMGRAVAWASPRARVGLDLELIEPRPRSFAGTWFTDREKEALADPRASTVAWATKEAVQKVLGAGMAVSPLDIEVLAWDPAGRVEVDLHGEARTRHHNLGGGLLEIVWREDTDGHVLVQARLVA